MLYNYNYFVSKENYLKTSLSIFISIFVRDKITIGYKCLAINILILSKQEILK